jgi:CAAX amino terminal protease family.
MPHLAAEQSPTSGKPTHHQNDRVHTPTRPDLPALALFLLVSFLGAWLVASPLWLSGQGLATPGSTVLLIAMMFTPSLGVLAVRLTLRRNRPNPPTGFRSPGIRRWWGWALVAWLAPLAITVLSLVLATAVGSYEPDFTLSGLSQLIEQQTGAPLPVSPWTIVIAQLVGSLVIGWLNVIPALGEEWGWRGWLLPELLGLGTWPALIISGVVWGLWHAPVILLGYNYPNHHPVVGLLLMVCFCTALSVVLGWMRLRSESVWPAAIGHAFVNAAAGLPVLFVAAGAEIDNASVGLLGWTGWVITGIAFLAGWRLTKSRTPDPAP